MIDENNKNHEKDKEIIHQDLENSHASPNEDSLKKESCGKKKNCDNACKSCCRCAELWKKPRVFIAGAFVIGLIMFICWIAYGSIAKRSHSNISEEAIVMLIKKNPEAIIESLQAHQMRQQIEEDRTREVYIQDFDANLGSYKLPFIGNPNGKHVVIEFFDYRCGFCKRQHEAMLALMKSDPELKVRLVEYPILGPTSTQLSSISVAVFTLYPDQFSQFHSLLMSRNFDGPDSVYAQMSSSLGFSADQISKIRTQVSTKSTADQINFMLDLGQKIGVNGTPALIIGNKFLSGFLDENALRRAISESK